MRGWRGRGRNRGATAGIVATVIIFSIIFTVGTGYAIFMNASEAQTSRSLLGASNNTQNRVGENLLLTTLLLPNGDVGFYVNDTSGLNANMTVVYVFSSTGALLKCDGVGLPASAGCSNTTPPLWIVVNAGKGSPTMDTGFLYVGPTTDTLKISTARGGLYTATYPPTPNNNGVNANTAQSLTINPSTFKWTTIQASPASLAQSRYTSNCNSASCGLQYSSSVTAGNTLVYGLGWYGQNSPSTPTDTLGGSFTLSASSSVVFTSTPSVVQHRYTANCNSSSCGLPFSSNVASGDLLAFGIGWYNQSPPSAPTDTRGDSFVLGASQSVVYNPPSASVVQHKYTSNCNAAACGLAYSSSVTAGNTLIDGLGWYSANPYSFVPVTITNNQNAATPNPFQQKLTWNPSSYSSYEAADLGNVRFCSDSACNTLLYAWLESCVAPTTCSTSSTSATAWVRLTSAIPASGGILTIYMVFESTAIDFDTNYWGEAPNLSSTYGQFDNGANVFTFYDNFAGTTLSGKWTAVKSAGGGVAVNNGATFTTAANSDWAFVISSSQTYPVVTESFMVSANNGADPMMGVATTQSSNGHVALYSGYSMEWVSGTGTEEYYNLPGSFTQMSTQAQGAFPSGIWTVTWSATGTEYFQDGAGNTYTGADSHVTVANYGMFVGVSNYCNCNNLVDRWGRTRAYPPSNTMPSVSLGSLTTGTGVPTLSDTIGDSFTLGASNSVTGNPSAPSLVQHRYAANCNASACGLQYASNVVAGNTLVYGLGWSANAVQYYVPITVTNTVGAGLSLDTNSPYTNDCSGANSCSLSVTTTKPNELIYVSFSNSGGGNSLTSFSDTAGLSWHQRGYAGSGSLDEYTYYAVSPAILSSDSITVQASNSGNLRFIALGVIGANLSTPFDTHAGIPATGYNGASQPATVTFTTSNANDLIVAGEKTGANAPSTGAAGYTFVNCCAATGLYANLEYKIVGAAGSQTPTFAWGGATDAWGEVGDAIQAAPSAATPATFQERVVWNPSTYQAYEANDLGNVRFCADTACSTMLNSWLESCTPSCTPTATSATAWVKLTAAIAGNGGTTTIYMTFSPTNVDFDTNFWGEAPNLSGAYGQFDNGASVFTILYQNFAGSSTPAGWAKSGTAYTINNGLTSASSAGAGTGGAFYTSATYGLSAVQIFDTYGEWATSACAVADNNVDFGYVTSGTPGKSVVGWAPDGSNTCADAILSSTGTFTSGANAVATSAFHVYSTYWSATGSSINSLDYNTYDPITATTPASAVNVGFTIYNSAGSYHSTGPYDWTRVRAYPPSGVMPATSFGSTTAGHPLPSTPTDTLGDTFLVGVSQSVVSGNTGYYSYIWYATASSSAADTITATFTYTVAGSVSIYELNGATTVGLLSSTGSSSAGSTSASVSSFTPSSNSFVVGNVETASSASKYTVGAGYATVAAGASGCDASNAAQGCSEYQSGLGSATTVPFTLSASTGWVESALSFAPVPYTYYSYIWYATASSSAADTITATFSVAVAGTVSIYELAGYSTTGTQSSTGAAASSSSASVSSFTPSSNSFVLGNVETGLSSTQYTTGAGYTSVATGANGCDPTHSAQGCNEYQSGFGSATTVPFTLSGATPWVESAMSFALATATTYYSYIWYTTAASSGADTISATFSGAVAGSVSLYEISSVTTAGVLSSTGSSSTGSATSSVGSITPSLNSVVIGNAEAGSTTFTAGAGGYALNAACNTVNGCSEYITSGGTATTVSMTLSPASAWVAAAVAFAPTQTTYYSYVWYATAVSSGMDTITATFSQSVTGAVSIYELAGYSTSNIKTSTGSSSAGSTTGSVTSFTPGGSSVVIGNVEAASTTFTAGVSYTLVAACNSVNGCSEYQTGVSSAATAGITLNPSAPWVEVAVAFPGAPALQSGQQVGGFPAAGIPMGKALAWHVQFTNQDPLQRAITLWPKSLAAVKSVMQETGEISPFFIVDGISSDGTTLIKYNSTHNFVLIPYGATVTVYFGSTLPLGTGTDTFDNTEIAPFTAFFALEGIYSDKSLFALTVPYPAGMVTQANMATAPIAGAAGITVTVSCTSPCFFNANAQSYVAWLDSTGKLTTVKTFTMSAGGNIPAGITFTVPAATAGFYTIVVSDYVNSVYSVFQHT